MPTEFEEYDEACQKIRKDNVVLLGLFEADLVKKGLSVSTINRHLDNVSFYLDTYLLAYDENDMVQGCYLIGDFLGYFFIRKCMWSTPSSIKTNAASIKRFYKFMLELGYIEAGDYSILVETIREGMPFWQDDCAEFNNLDQDSEFFRL